MSRPRALTVAVAAVLGAGAGARAAEDAVVSGLVRNAWYW